MNPRNILFLTWGIGSLGTTAMIASISFIALYYLIQVVGLSPALAGTVIFVGKAIDFVIYPLMGVVTDRTRSRWGRRRPYLQCGAIACALTFVMLYAIPPLPSSFATAAYAAVALALYAVALAVFFVPYMAQPADMTSEPRERNAIMAFRSLFLMIGTLVGSALIAMLVERFGGGRNGYRAMAFIVGAVILVSLITAFIGTASLPDHPAPISDPGFVRRLRSVWKSKAFVILVGIQFLQFVGTATGSAVILFFVTLVMHKSGDWLAIYGVAIIATAALTMRPWMTLIGGVGKKHAYRIAIVGYAVAMCTWLAAGPGESQTIFILRAALVGISAAGLLICGQSMVLDAVHEDSLQNAEGREGTLMALYAFGEKVAGALGPLVAGLLLAAYGFDPKAAAAGTINADTRLALEIGLVWIMVAVSAIIVGLLQYYRLDERMPK